MAKNKGNIQYLLKHWTNFKAFYSIMIVCGTYEILNMFYIFYKTLYFLLKQISTKVIGCKRIIF